MSHRNSIDARSGKRDKVLPWLISAGIISNRPLSHLKVSVSGFSEGRGPTIPEMSLKAAKPVLPCGTQPKFRL